MSFTPLFSVAQPLGEPSVITITDTSVGTDAAITQRRVYLRDAFGNNVLPEGTSTEYVEWDWADSSIDIDCLTKDQALLITVQWLNVSNAILYDTQDKTGCTSYNEDFSYSAIQMLTTNPNRVNDNGFLLNLGMIRIYIDAAFQALTRYGDMYTAQRCYDLATEIRLNSTYLFNTN
jgi:hypothetical protein